MTAETAAVELLARIEANVRAVAARGRDSLDVGPFRAFVSPDSPSYLLSLAVPFDPPDDVEWSSAIAALDAAFAARGRKPRVEYLHDRHPSLGAALDAAGYQHTMSAPVMVLTPDRFRLAGPVPGAEIVRLAADDDATLDAFLAMQIAAYGATVDDADSAWRSMMQAGLAGGTIVGGVLTVDGQVVSGASLLLGAGAGELAGVGTLPGRQRSGLATDVCGRILEAFFAAGHELCWLSAAPGAQGVYERLGFRIVGEQRNYGRAPV